MCNTSIFVTRMVTFSSHSTCKKQPINRGAAKGIAHSNKTPLYLSLTHKHLPNTMLILTKPPLSKIWLSCKGCDENFNFSHIMCHTLSNQIVWQYWVTPQIVCYQMLFSSLSHCGLQDVKLSTHVIENNSCDLGGEASILIHAAHNEILKEGTYGSE